MDKRTVIQELNLMIDYRLFGNSPYLVDRESGDALGKKLDEMGLRDSDDNTSRSTVLGLEMQMDLISVFLGLHWEFEVPGILERYGLIDEYEIDKILDKFEKMQTAARENEDLSNDYGRVLRPVVQKAYRDHYQPSRLLN